MLLKRCWLTGPAGVDLTVMAPRGKAPPVRVSAVPSAGASTNKERPERSVSGSGTPLCWRLAPLFLWDPSVCPATWLTHSSKGHRAGRDGDVGGVPQSGGTGPCCQKKFYHPNKTKHMICIPGPSTIVWEPGRFPMTVFLSLMGEQKVSRQFKQCHRTTSWAKSKLFR